MIREKLEALLKEGIVELDDALSGTVLEEEEEFLELIIDAAKKAKYLLALKRALKE